MPRLQHIRIGNEDPDSGNLSGCAHTLRIPPRGMQRQGHSKHTHTRTTGAAGVEGAGGTGGHGRASRRGAASNTSRKAAAGPAGPGRGAGGRRQGQGGPRDRPLRAVRLACGDLAGGPPPTGTHSGPAHSGRPRGGRRSGGQSNAGDLAGTQPQQAAPRAAAAQ